MFLIPWRGARLVVGIVRLEAIREEVGAALPALVVVVVEHGQILAFLQLPTLRSYHARKRPSTPRACRRSPSSTSRSDGDTLQVRVGEGSGVV